MTTIRPFLPKLGHIFSNFWKWARKTPSPPALVPRLFFLGNMNNFFMNKLENFDNVLLNKKHSYDYAQTILSRFYYLKKHFYSEEQENG